MDESVKDGTQVPPVVPPKEGEQPPVPLKDGEQPPLKKEEVAPVTKTALTSSEEPLKPEVKAPVVPEKYDLKLPENAILVDGDLDILAASARKLGLSNDAAQELVNSVNDQIAKRDAAILEASKPGGAEWVGRTTAWEEEAKKDPEIGGANYTANVNVAIRVLDQFFPKSVKDFLHETGYGSHPDVIRGLAKFGKAIGESKFVEAGAEADETRTAAQILFPNTHSKKKE